MNDRHPIPAPVAAAPTPIAKINPATKSAIADHVGGVVGAMSLVRVALDKHDLATVREQLAAAKVRLDAALGVATEASK